MWQQLHQRYTPELIEYLELHEPNTSSIISNIKFASTVYNPYVMRSGHYFIYISDRKVEGMMVFYNDGNAFIHTDNDDAKQTSIKILVKSKFHSVWGLSDWLPNLSLLSTNIGIQMDARELLTMARDKTVPLPKSQYDLVRIDRKYNLNKYMPFLKTCLYEGFGFRPYSRDLKKRMRERTEEEPYFLLYDNKEPVSQCHIQAVSRTHGYIAGICTPRAYRRRGYARQITARACRFIEGRGCTSALTVNETNTGAVNLYKSMGFVAIDKMQVYMKSRKFTGDENLND
ncbi:MAG: GNAT family N-acetyltransferase [Clostridia bacterium]|nr:GNAT family N-acetyltransferase [Clostridia bacterium]